MLDTLTERRLSLQDKIKNFSADIVANPPSALRIVVDGNPVVFPIDKTTGKVSNLPNGAWGWVRGFRWLDLKDYLKNVHRYEVEVVMPGVMAAV